MGPLPLARAVPIAIVLALLAASETACHNCGLAEHDRVTVSPTQSAGLVPGDGGAVYQDISLKAATSDPEFSLSNTNYATEPGGVDAFLVPTTCETLFEGGYPGGTPLCKIYVGPAKPGGVSSRAKLDPGTYRLYLQGYSDVTSPVKYLIDVYIWDYRCNSLIQ
ncbi:MAG TPA: hypothetical protein VGI12_08635 [Vicinamibacterales bacterium]|jgi:hypothetical protein